MVLAVIAVHLLLLSGLPEAWQAAPAQDEPVMQTRTVVAAPAVPTAAGPATPARRPAAPAARPVEAAAEAQTPSPAARADHAPAAKAAPAVETAPVPPTLSAGAEPQGSGASTLLAPPTRLLYRVHAQTRGLNYNAKAELLWEHDSQRYDARLTISAFLIGSRVQTSTGLLSAGGLAPLRFADRRRGEQAAHFEREKGRISFSANTPYALLLPGAQDRLSVFVQLGALLAAQPTRQTSGSVLAIQTAGTRDAETWQFEVRGPARLALEGQTLDTVELVRQPRKEYDTQIELWLAPSLHYLPARIRITQAGGDQLDLRLTEAVAAGAPGAGEGGGSSGQP